MTGLYYYIQNNFIHLKKSWNQKEMGIQSMHIISDQYIVESLVKNKINFIGKIQNSNRGTIMCRISTKLVFLLYQKYTYRSIPFKAKYPYPILISPS